MKKKTIQETFWFFDKWDVMHMNFLEGAASTNCRINLWKQHLQNLDKTISRINSLGAAQRINEIRELTLHLIHILNWTITPN